MTVRKLGTGKTDGGATSRKWAQGVKDQMSSVNQPTINTRFVPLLSITLDSKNPRQMSLTPEDVQRVIKSCPLQSTWLTSDAQPTDFWDDYTEAVQQHLGGTKAAEFLEIALLALSIKDHDGLINPVTLYSGDSGTDLRLVAGERRFLSHLMLEENVISARILNYRPTRFELDVLQWQENTLRKDLSLSESILNIERLIAGWQTQKGAELRVRELVTLAGVTRMNAHRYLTVINSVHKEQLLKLIDREQVTSLSKAAQLAALSAKEFLFATASKSKSPPSKKPLVTIGRKAPLPAVQKVIQLVVEGLDDEKLRAKLLESPPATTEECADRFDQLIAIVSKQLADVSD